MLWEYGTEFFRLIDEQTGEIVMEVCAEHGGVTYMADVD